MAVLLRMGERLAVDLLHLTEARVVAPGERRQDVVQRTARLHREPVLLGHSVASAQYRDALGRLPPTGADRGPYGIHRLDLDLERADLTGHGGGALAELDRLIAAVDHRETRELAVARRECRAGAGRLQQGHSLARDLGRPGALAEVPAAQRDSVDRLTRGEQVLALLRQGPRLIRDRQSP